MSPRLFLLHCDEGNVVVILFPLRRGFTLVVAGENDLSVALTISVHFLIIIVARASISTLDLSRETKNFINFLSHQAHHFFRNPSSLTSMRSSSLPKRSANLSPLFDMMEIRSIN